MNQRLPPQTVLNRATQTRPPRFGRGGLYEDTLQLGASPPLDAVRARLWAAWFGIVMVGFFWQFTPKVLAVLLPRLAG